MGPQLECILPLAGTHPQAQQIVDDDDSRNPFQEVILRRRQRKPALQPPDPNLSRPRSVAPVEPPCPPWKTKSWHRLSTISTAIISSIYHHHTMNSISFTIRDRACHSHVALALHSRRHVDGDSRIRQIAGAKAAGWFMCHENMPMAKPAAGRD